MATRTREDVAELVQCQLAAAEQRHAEQLGRLRREYEEAVREEDERFQIEVLAVRALPGHSRVPRINTFSGEELFQMGWGILSHKNHVENRWNYLTRVWTAAASRGSTDAQYLLNLAVAHGGIGDDAEETPTYAAFLLHGVPDTSPQALFWRGWALYINKRVDEGVPLLLAAAERGFCRAFSWCGVAGQGNVLEWYQRAAEATPVPDTGALAQCLALGGLGNMEIQVDIEEALRLNLLGAKFGQFGCMARAGRMMLTERDNVVEAARLFARLAIFTKDFTCLNSLRESLLKDALDGTVDANVGFAIGRELDGIDELWQDGDMGPSVEIELYNGICQRVRQVALFAVFAFMPRFGRDVARLIGRLVYATRNDLSEWLGEDDDDDDNDDDGVLLEEDDAA